ncbi:hypothetical protein, partial [Escherichia coli]|uniref:hypothetical protein n=1 Tax=Escherichia coli TaxID=562 RepID=UPI0019D5AEB3
QPEKLSTGNFVFLMHSMPCVEEGDKKSRPRRRAEPLPASRATRQSRTGRIDRHAVGRHAAHVNLAPANR